MPLRARLTAAFLVVVLGPVLLGAVFIGTAVDAVAAGRASDRLDAAAAAISSTVSARCDRLTGSANAIALLHSEKSAMRSVAERVVSDGRAASVVVDDAEDSAPQTFGRVAAAVGSTVRCDRPADSGRTLTALKARTPIHDAAGRERGSVTVAAPIDTAFVRSLASRVSGVDVTVDDSRDRPLSSLTDRALATRTLKAAGETVDDDTSGRYVRAMKPRAESPVPLVLATKPPGTQSLFATLVAIIVTAAVLAVAAATWLARSTTRPLAELAGGADAVANGDLATRVPVRGHDEIATVARSFNRMARETQGYVSALTASRDQLRGQLALLGETLSSTLDLDRILEVIVDTSMAVTGARSGIVLLVDPVDPQTLRGRAGDGFGTDDPDITEVAVRLGDGLLGRVAADGLPRRGRIGGTEETVLPAAGEPVGATYLAVPVRAVTPGSSDAEGVPTNGTLLGVLAIYDRLGGDEFDEVDLSTLRTFAGQAAVAVGNVLSHQEVQRLSLTDPLTGLWNYRYLQVSLAREVERAGRFHRSAAVIALDLDRFKAVNDTYGHPVGDTVLFELAQRISAEIREVDLAFRYGGEEFVVLLPEADAEGASRVAERLATAVREAPMTIRGPGTEYSVGVTVSLGVAAYPEHGVDGSAVLAAADEALYAAKAAGRDTWRLAHPEKSRTLAH